jgi:hypothetical protein
MTTTPPKTIHMARYDGFVDWETGSRRRTSTTAAWHREPASYRIVTVGESREPVTSMAACQLLPRRRFRRTT